MKIIVTTSDNYLHLIPIFTYLFNKYWGPVPVEVVGYKEPHDMPINFTFHSMGKQGDVCEWSTDLRKYFEQQPEKFIWLMEDTIIRKVDTERIPSYLLAGVGKICLTNDVSKRDHVIMMDNDYLIKATQTSRYRLSTQPSIWNKEYLLQYLTPGLTPWQFETQDPMNDGWDVYGIIDPIIICNEGVRKHDPFTVDLNKLPQKDIDYIKSICTWLK